MPKVLMPIGDARKSSTRCMRTFDSPRMVSKSWSLARPCEAITWCCTRFRPPPNRRGISRANRLDIHLATTVAFRDVDPAEFVGLFVSGGRAPEYLRYDADLLRITSHFFAAGKPVAATLPRYRNPHRRRLHSRPHRDDRGQMCPGCRARGSEIRQRVLRRRRQPGHGPAPGTTTPRCWRNSCKCSTGRVERARPAASGQARETNFADLRLRTRRFVRPPATV